MAPISYFYLITPLSLYCGSIGAARHSGATKFEDVFRLLIVVSHKSIADGQYCRGVAIQC